MSAAEQHSVKAQTEYVILQQIQNLESTAGRWEAVDRYYARSAETAIRFYAGQFSEPMTLVAVPIRNWNPLRVTPRTVTTLEIEEA